LNPFPQIGQKDVEAYQKRCADRDRASFCYRGKELQIQRQEAGKQREEEYERAQEKHQLEGDARGDVEKYIQDCKGRRRLSLAFRAKEQRQHLQWLKEKSELESQERRQRSRAAAIDMRYVELAKQKERARDALNALRHTGAFLVNPFASLLEK
jgi:hypothetical protein